MYPYDVLLRTETRRSAARLASALRDLGLRVVTVHDAREMIREEQKRLERQGILGLLSIGFLGSAVLTLIGFLFHSFVSLQRRLIELGILRAIGLSARQVVLFLALNRSS